MLTELHKRVPREYGANLRWRRFVLQKAKDNPELQQALREVCRLDILFFINCFVFQTNPNKGIDGTVGPFITWGFQEKAIVSRDPEEPGILWCTENREDLVVEKSRDMGATWIFLMVMDHLCRFRNYHDSLMMSKSALAVDGPSRQSLFGKLRFLHEHLPKWLHDTDNFADQKNYFGYPGTNSTVTGFSSTGRSGVSERGSEMFFDEFSQVEEDFEVLYRTASTTKCRMFNGTHLGTGTAFYELTQSKTIKKLMFHWTQHPDKNKGMYRWNSLTCEIEFLRYNDETSEIEQCESYYPWPGDYEFDKTGNPTGGPHPGVRSPWYDKEFERITRNLEEMAKDQDINPTGSVSQFYNPLVIRNLIETTVRPPREYELEYNAKTGVPIKFVPTIGGRIKLWIELDAYGKPPIDFYGAGTDVSGGTGCTPSCLSIMRAGTGEKVLEYANANIKPWEFGVFAVAVCQMFRDPDGNGAKIAWEHHGPGCTFGEAVWKDLGYLRVYCATHEHQFKQTVSDKPGWNPTLAIHLHTDYRRALYERTCINRSKDALAETLNFKHNGRGSVEHTQYASKNDPSGGRENHGDQVVADALAWKMIKGIAKTLAKQEEKVAKPGTLQYLLNEEAQIRERSGELYPNWNRRR